jgi:hypothetical protein
LGTTKLTLVREVRFSEIDVPLIASVDAGLSPDMAFIESIRSEIRRLKLVAELVVHARMTQGIPNNENDDTTFMNELLGQLFVYRPTMFLDCFSNKQALPSAKAIA